MTVLGIGVERMESLHPVKHGLDRVELLNSIACILDRSPRVVFVQERYLMREPSDHLSRLAILNLNRKAPCVRSQLVVGGGFSGY